jgi:UDP-N-acetylglucosamine 1-carboxyvinyltransferase
MSKYVIEGGKRLAGELSVHGAKNAVLPILAAALLTKETQLHNCPELSDVSAACGILSYLGCAVTRGADHVRVDTESFSRWDIPDSLMREMRSSVVFLGAIIARCGRARVSLPGGCDALWRRAHGAFPAK